MASDQDEVAARELRVNEAIAAYLKALDAGQAMNATDFLAEHAEVANELKSFIENLQGMEAWRTQSTDVRLPQEIPTHRIVGGYEILGELARGGMGVVYKAKQQSLNRIVALKMILAGQNASQEVVQRFQAEAEAAANLDHPGIVPVYEVGVIDGKHFFSMGYVHGKSLAEQLQSGPMPSRISAALLVEVCSAVHYAHQHGVIHRDLKPANILLEQVDGPGDVSEQSPDVHSVEIKKNPDLSESKQFVRPRITDFGLAKRLYHGPELTQADQLLGTPCYMSPEQATAGTKSSVGPASDVYSLGAVMYHMLTGRPPFQAETAVETISQLLDQEPLPPRLLNRNVAPELEAICMNCLAKLPESRYASARELGADLQRYLHGERVRASGVHLIEQVSRALRPVDREEHFRKWGLGLLAFGGVILVSHVVMYWSDSQWSNVALAYFLPRLAMLGTLLWLLWRSRPYTLLPTNSAEKLVWVVWLGYLLAVGASNVTRLVLGHPHQESYAAFAILAGFGFLVMGGHVWSGSYFVGLIFLAAAPMLAYLSELAPLVSGLLWAVALMAFGLHYYRIGPRT